MLKRLLAIALLFAVTPAAAEVAEAVAHLASHGDYVHADDGRHQPMGHDEHGCTPSLHLCLCHVGTPAVVRYESDHVSEDLSLAKAPGDAPVSWLGRLAEPPPLPPPIA